MMVHYEAKMYNIVGERSEHSAMEILRKEWFFTMPLIIITIFMLSGYSPGYSAILGLATCIVVSYKYEENRIDYTLAVVMALVLSTQMTSLLLSKTMGPDAGRSFNHIFSERTMVFAGLALCVIWYVIKKDHRPTINTGLKRFVDASRAGAENSLKIGATIGVIGIIIGVLTYSGLMLTFLGQQKGKAEFFDFASHWSCARSPAQPMGPRECRPRRRRAGGCGRSRRAS